MLALYTAITLYLLSPVLPVFNRAIAGDWRATIDGWQNVWGIWWVGHALATGQNPFFTPLLFYPDGASLYFQTLNMTNGLLTLPVQWLWGPLAAYNAAILLGFVLTGYGAYLLTRSLVGHRGAAVLAGAIYTFCPFHLLKFWEGQLEWVTLQWIPFFLLFLLRAFDSGRLRWRLLAALFLVLVSLTSWYGSLFSLIATGLIVLLRLPAAWQRGHWQRDLVTLLVVVGGGGLLLLPVLLPALHEAQGCYRWGVDRTPRAADALDILLPSDLHPLWGKTVRRWNGHIRNTKGGWDWNIAHGYSVLVLAVVGSVAYWRQVWRWVVLVLLLSTLLPGPVLTVAGLNTGVPMPYALFDLFPILGTLRRPNHIVVISFLFVAVLAAYGVRWLLSRGGGGRAVVVLMVCLLVVEYAVVPPPRIPLHIHPVVYQLRGNGKQDGAVLQLKDGNYDTSPMRNQMIHHRPIVGGYLARNPCYPFTEYVPGVVDLRHLYSYEPPDNDIVPHNAERRRQALSFYRVRTLLIPQTPKTAPIVQRRVAAVLPGLSPSYRDSEVVVYDIPPVAEPRPFFYLRSGWYSPEYQQQRVWRWMQGQAIIQLVNPTDAPRPVVLTMAIESYGQTRPLTLALAPAGSSGTRQIIASNLAISPARRLFRLPLVLPPGEHTLHLSSPAKREQASPHRSLSLAFTRIEVGGDR